MSYLGYFFDMDGTLFRGEEVVLGGPAALAALRASGRQIYYATNNSALTQQAYAQKLSRLGYEASAEEVLTSGTVTRDYLHEQKIKNVFVIGEPGLVTTLVESGIHVVNRAADGGVEALRTGADALVVGICRSRLSFDLLDCAMQVVLGGGAFIATNPDTTYPLEGGRLSPGNGAGVAYMAACTGTAPLLMGKPETRIVEQALNIGRISPQDLLVVGDRADTDLECGARLGCPTLLVLTGVQQTPISGQASLDSVAELTPEFKI